MGTYCYVTLKSNELCHKANQELAQMGYPIEYHNGIMYGAFVTYEQILNDLYFLNCEPEGLKQVPHWKRPITIEYLEENVFWIRRNQFCEKFPDPKITLVLVYIYQHLDYVDEKLSSNWKPDFIKKYYPEMAKEVDQLMKQ